MKNEEKVLLLKDIFARLPYGVKVAVVDFDGTINKRPVTLLRGGWYEEYENGEYMCITSYYGIAHKAEDIRPYLRPMSSMTEEERKELFEIEDNMQFHSNSIYSPDRFDFYTRKHFDYRGLIPMGLALEAEKGMYN